jgi:TatD DNase family protein
MKIFDSHAHLNDEEFEKDLKEVIERGICNGIEKIIVVGFDVPSSYHALKLATEYKGLIFASCGIHPHEADNFEEGIKEIEELSKQKEVVAIGETGLDYYKNYSSREKQIESFIAHIEIARKVQKPIIIHTRKSFGDTFNILKNYKDLKGVFHCFSGGKEEAIYAQKMGFYISFSGSITYNSKKLEESLKNTSLEKLIVETDSPYLTPFPLKGRCEPFYIIYTIKKISEILNMEEKEIAEKTYKNAQILFNLT